MGRVVRGGGLEGSGDRRAGWLLGADGDQVASSVANLAAQLRAQGFEVHESTVRRHSPPYGAAIELPNIRQLGRC
jgi:hypothetical protein